MEENETDVVMQTQTIHNIAYEGITSHYDEVEGVTSYINGKFQEDVPVYECI